jgi:capsular exopolysaccharide synthesis family protein
LQDALSKVTALEVMQTGDAQVVDTADPPSSPSSPRPKLDAIVGLLLGLALGVGLAFLIDMLDRRIKSTEDFEALYGLRALATVPERHRAPRNERERNAQLEPFRILRNGLSFLSVGQQVQTVLVTSSISGEGKSTVAAGLARAVALSGQSVILVEVDLRRPSLSSIFDLGDNPRGVTTALVGNVSPGELLRHPLAGLRSFSVLPSGPLPPNAAELLRSAEMSILLEDLRRRAEVIVLDAPPLLPVADAQVLLDNPQIDACLVVGRAFHTRREQARRARIILERHRLRNIGLVVNALHQVDASYDYYDEGEDGRRPPIVVDTPPVVEDEPARVLPLPRGQRR